LQFGGMSKGKWVSEDKVCWELFSQRLSDGVCPRFLVVSFLHEYYAKGKIITHYSLRIRS
jgi:hypothetical protein